MASPGEHQRYHWKAARSERQPSRVAVRQMTEVEILPRKGRLPHFCDEAKPHRSTYRMLKAALQWQDVRRAEAIVLITLKRLMSVEVAAAESRLKIERHNASR